jgi:ferredoxin-type protein NapG
MAFLAACTRCGACNQVCPAGAILTVSARGGLAANTPYLEPSRIPCLACADMPCVAACPTAALTMPETGWRTERLGRVEFEAERCITFEGKPCRVCIDACPVGTAALTAPETGWRTERLGRVEFEAERCITFEGKPCRVCIDACPVGTAALAQDDEGHPVLKAEGCVACGACVRECITIPSSFTFHAVER